MIKERIDQKTKKAANKKIIPLEELNLTDRFLFDEVMEDPQTQQDVLSIILDKEISLLIHNETEKEFRISPLIRSIRMDVFSEDVLGAIYNTEMQNTQKPDLAKRSRYYQALVDTSLLEPGIPDYNVLKDSFLITIMTFDMFGYDLYRYTFLPQCVEVPGLVLPDGATRMFLNTKGKNNTMVSYELIGFLKYVEETTDEVAASIVSERIQRIHKRVCKVKASEKVGVKYMQAWEEKYYARMEAIAEGKAEGRAIGLALGKEEGLAEGRNIGLAEGRNIGLAEGRNIGLTEGRNIGLTEGRNSLLKEQIRKKLERGKNVKVIADELEENEEIIRKLIGEMYIKNIAN